MSSKGKTNLDNMMRGIRHVKQGQPNLKQVYSDVKQLRKMFALFDIKGRDVKDLIDPTKK